ncbi:hypothetical protein [Romboutsia sp.]|uniref:hypothetical protein n=1 Tax=Romboutsia sp. TaxID=1965302 RepID=UPI003F2EFABE
MNFIKEKYAKTSTGKKLYAEEDIEEDIEARSSEGTVTRTDSVDIISSGEADIVESAYSTLGEIKTYNMVKKVSADGHSCKITYNASFPITHTITATVSTSDPIIEG